MNPPRNRIRALPFYFSQRFFLVFVSGSFLLIVAYLVHPFGLAVPVSFNLLLLAFTFTDYATSSSDKSVRVKRAILYPLKVDKFTTVPLNVVNNGHNDLEIIIEDDVPSDCLKDIPTVRMVAHPGSGNNASYRIKPLIRGDCEFGAIHFWIRSKLGLVWKHGCSRSDQMVKCYPGLAIIEQQNLQLRISLQDQLFRSDRKKGAGTEFDSLRDYATGDDPRLIHWGATARKAKVMVRRHRIEGNQNVFIILDTGRMMTARVGSRTKLDHAVNAAVVLAYGALSLGDKVGIMTIGEDIGSFLPPANSPTQFGKILDSIYTIRPEFQEPQFFKAFVAMASRLKRRSLVIMFTDLIDERSSGALKNCVSSMIPKHLPFIAALSDTEVVDSADKRPKTLWDVYEKGVAAELLVRRDLLITRLHSMGVLIVDTNPEQVSAAVLDKYLQIKIRGTL